MSVYSEFDFDTGRFVGTLELDNNQPAPEELNFVEGDYSPNEHMVVDGRVVPIKDWEPAVSSNTVRGIPANTLAVWGDLPSERVLIDDGELEFDLVPGQKRFVTLYPPGYAHKKVELVS